MATDFRKFTLLMVAASLLVLVACGPAAPPAATVVAPTVDATATAASAIILAALTTPTNRQTDSAAPEAQTPQPALPAEAAVPAQPNATDIAATVAAEVLAPVTATPAPTPAPPPADDATAFAVQVATQVASELEHAKETMTAAAPAEPPPTRVPTPTPSRTPAPTPTATPTAISPSVITQPSSGRETGSIWSLTTFEDLSSPGANNYAVIVDAASTLRWAFEWCATSDAQLSEILAPLEVGFSIDGRKVMESEMTRGAKSSGGWRCRYWATEVSAWPRGQTVRLEIHYRLATAINDGQNSYPAGDYYQVIYATVR